MANGDLKLFVLKKRQATLGGKGYRKMLVVAHREQEARVLAEKYFNHSNSGFDVDATDSELVDCACIGTASDGVNEPKVLLSYITPA